jgi:hypothetical protein
MFPGGFRVFWIRAWVWASEESDCHSERGLTAALSGAFEARNGLFDRLSSRQRQIIPTSAEGTGMVDVDNESNQVS